MAPLVAAAIPLGYTYLESSPGLIAITLPSITAMAPLVAAVIPLGYTYLKSSPGLIAITLPSMTAMAPLVAAVIPLGYTYLESSPGLIAITLPSMTAMAPLVAAATKSLCTLNTALSRSNLSGRFFLGSSRVVWISSFQSLVCIANIEDLSVTFYLDILTSRALLGGALNFFGRDVRHTV